ncbi:glycogen/starch synthase [Pseudoalteromonas sp. McH1-7]|uniref:glycogen synthase n=1 Tax=unclassified Pseudoalteromonas TaxID=194690 RepID=UPI0015903023|nr:MULTISPECIES: glycogen/starch synthase [unclassified Pseudoalteromonas]NUZ10112.1 glycogen/starch synthase [Pseudoalteromonas sp. McH1-7]USD30687.1 glycogen/starch synthase [Pseudoalteromonas sp. SCSIO 43201]
MHVILVAAENDRLPNCKVGGVADVIRDIPYALAELGIKVSVVTPDYGQIALNRHFVADIAVPFRQHLETATLWSVEKSDGVTQYVVSHSLFSEHHGAIYCNDTHQPFATDANRFAFFSAAVAELIEHELIADIDVVHLHDWHAAVVAVLRRFSPRFKRLKQLKTVYTVHNLALQGIRPFNHDFSSLESWFPTLTYDGLSICDPKYPHCFNPMRAAINLTDRVHVVSPNYAKEVMLPSHRELGFFGGEGLEGDMQHACHEGRLAGILNGCVYAEDAETHCQTNLIDYLKLAESHVFQWMAKSNQVLSRFYIAHQRIQAWLGEPFEGKVITSVGRLTDQKALILRQPTHAGIVLDNIAELAGRSGARIIIVGSGDPALEQLFTEIMARHGNVLFLNGYGKELGELLYLLGDLFLMPSSFEPCGISQMLAMRAGQPCIVHKVGGLADTVKHNETGYCFEGDTLAEQGRQLIAIFELALADLCNNQIKYQALCQQAKLQRFDWYSVAQKYTEQLYR